VFLTLAMTANDIKSTPISGSWSSVIPSLTPAINHRAKNYALLRGLFLLNPLDCNSDIDPKQRRGGNGRIYIEIGIDIDCVGNGIGLGYWI